jgi:hypothetical protein
MDCPLLSFNTRRYPAVFSFQPRTKKGMTLMKRRFSPQAEDSQRLQFGPICHHVQSFSALVSQQGYCNVNGWSSVQVTTLT